MNYASIADLIAAYVLAPTFVWGAIAALAASLSMRTLKSNLVSEGLERARLSVMVAPALIGAVAVIAARAAPGAMPELPSFPALEGLRAQTGDGARAARALTARDLDWLSLPIRIAVGVYLAGAAVLLARLAVQLYVLGRIVRRAAANAMAADVVNTHERTPPFASLTGKVVMPDALKRSLTPDQLDLIIAHERAHIRRGDPVAFAFYAAIDAVFWVNPFIRKQTSRCRMAAELACDAAVTGTAPHLRKAYAGALVSALKHAAGHARPCAPAVFSTRNIGECRMRIEHIMSEPPRRRKRAGWAAMAAIALSTLPATWLHVAWAQEGDAGELTVLPVEGRLSSAFGPRTHPVTHQIANHYGIDIAAPAGSPVRAAGPGRVTRAGYRSTGYGNVVEIRHSDSIQTRYAMLSGWEVEEGDEVEAGQIIGGVGSSGANATGPHLHWEVFRDSVPVDPADMVDLSSLN